MERNRSHSSEIQPEISPFRVISTPITPIFQSIGMMLQNFFISLLVTLGGALSGQDSGASWFFGLLLLPAPSQPLSQ
ncbi:hypothetical protein CDV49_12675 [Haematobacter genomosp. 1]|uniref:Uncharacterized protein n=1 Tax=Haematobacter genomosp. 1 TaxID=366618 RepID=A0A212AA51_9RHOB|nr:hypothetical protein CDV49_12675 [Haematobacter genomosp. 1]